MQDYSLYMLGRSGRLVREIEIDCVDDDAAIDQAQRWVDGYDVELWQLDRLVCRFRGIGKRPHPIHFWFFNEAGQLIVLSRCATERIFDALQKHSCLCRPLARRRGRTSYAVRMAFRHGAHLIGIFAVPSIYSSPAESFVRGQQAVRLVIANHQSSEAAAMDAANRSFSAGCAREGISFEFRFLRQGDVNDSVTLNSLHTDLVIVGGPRAGGLPRDWSAEALLLATGVPFLLLPKTWTGSTAEHVVVAWNASREARRAITDALPFLVGAQSVTILVVDPQKNPRHGEEPGADVAHYLTRHGAKVVVEQVQSRGEPIAKVILGLCRTPRYRSHCCRRL